jgi:DNA polymerase bacteriophage-type
MTTPVLFIDFETRSPVDLKTAGLARYALDPATEILMMAWAFGDEPIALWEPGSPLPERVRSHLAVGGIVVGHNAQFELTLWNTVARRGGWPRLDPRQVRCTMAACYAMALPGALENAAHALGLTVSKDNVGRALMLRMCKPCGTDGGRPVYHDGPDMRARLGEYCKQDVAVEREIYKRVLPLTDQEQRIWTLDQEINRRGVPFDMASLQAAMDVAATEKDRLDGELGKATGGAVTACSALPALKAWAADYGVMPDGLAKAEVNELLDYENLPDPVRIALKIRQAAGRFTSISKLKAIKLREIAARVMFLFQYHAATPGRWAGRGVQPHNFTRDLPKPHDVEAVLQLLREGNTRWLDMLYGEPSIMISKCLRGFIKAPRGRQLIGGDFSSIEGRGLAWLAGEHWKVEAFAECDADPELPDMYERAYAKTFNRDPSSVTTDERQIGKVEELAFGYQGGVGAFRTMGKTYNVRVVASLKDVKPGGQIITEQQADDFKRGWRDAHPRIKQYWYDLQDTAIHATQFPGEITRAGAAGRQVMFRKRGSFLWCRLPSGRTLCYPYPMIYTDRYGPHLTYKGVPDATVWAIYAHWLQFGKPAGDENPTYIEDEAGNSREWCRIKTYGGKLAENITQAICRDLLAEAMLRIDAAGFGVVLHVHDEIVVEGVFTEQDRIKFEALMCQVPAWAAGFPIKAGCWLSERYVKG